MIVLASRKVCGSVTLRSGNLAEETAAPGPEVVDLEERGWLARHCRGDATAFPALMAAYRRPVYGFLVRGGVAESDRDDLFQSIFLKIHGAAESYDPSRPLAPWLFTIVANSLRNHFRSKAAALPASPQEDPGETADPAADPERIAAARETVAWLEAAIHALPLAQREVLLLVTVAGLGQQDTAEALEMPLNTVKTHLRRARLALAAELAAHEGAFTGGSHDKL